MKETGKELAKVPVAQEIDTAVSHLINSIDLTGFQRAVVMASTYEKIDDNLTKEFMGPIMKMQGTKIGFKTDKDTTGGYTMDVVKRCLIEAVLTGVNVYGNQFNIIAGNCYITKEGYGHLLGKIQGLDQDIIPELPRISQDKNSAAVKVKITWSISNGPKQEKEMEFPIKTNQYMGADGVIGKATRKARKWLFEKLTGIETSDGDTEDVSYKVVGKDGKDQEEKAEQVKEGITGLFDNKK